MSFLPLLYPAVLLLLPLLFLRRGRRAFAWSAAISAVLLALPVAVPLLHGAGLRRTAEAGQAAAQYEYARWCENHGAQIARFLPWPDEPDHEAGFAWLVRAAMQRHPPALFALGARLKHELFVPEAWYERGVRRGEAERIAQGQAMIDEALALGFRPATDDRAFYWSVFRR